MQANHSTRRSFLKKTALAGMAVVAAPHLPSTAAEGEEGDKTGPLTFLFQGDSITDGNRGRSNDPNHIMGHGYAFSIASRAGAAFPEKALTFYNRGISGNTVADLAARWRADTLDLKPNVLSLLVGVNDTEGALRQKDTQAIVKFEEGYRALLESTRAQLPHCSLVLCEPFSAPVGRVKDRWEDWQREMGARQEVVRRLAGDYSALFVPLQKVFDDAARRVPASYWIWDGIHPTVAGHELLAQQWMKTVGKQFSFLRKLVR